MENFLLLLKNHSIPSPTPTIPPSQAPQDIPLTSQVQQTPPQSPQGRMIDDMDKDDVVVLMDEKEEGKKVEEAKSMSAKRTLWNEFSSAMASAVICLSTSRKFNFSKYIFESLEVEDLKRNLEIVPDEDDDVYTEATPLARKNFNREDLEALWNLAKERFSTSKPKNFSDDFLLNTLGAMFEKPDGQA
nr:hypothetical protein [Tanacetum cinerariifolium]